MKKIIEMIYERSGVIINQLIVLLGVGFICLMVNPVYAGNWWEQDFQTNPPRHWLEDNGSGSWGKFWSHGCNPHNPWHVSVVSGGHPVRAGTQSIRFENRAGQMRGDCKYPLAEWGERTELLGSEKLDRPGNDSWYAWSVFHRNFTIIENIAATHGQFKTLNAGHQYVMFRMDSNRGMVAVFDVFEGFSNAKVIIPKNQLSNKWHDIRVRAKWSTGADGVFQIWVNGVLKVNRRGRNAIDNDPILFRFGIYKSDTYQAINNHNQVVYYDEVMRGSTCQSVSQFMACDSATDLETYVNKYGDLLAAYNANSGGQSKAAWGKRHYCNYGHGEGRTSAGLTLAICATDLNATAPTIEVSVNDIPEGGNRFSSEIIRGVREFSKAAVFNGNIFSFKDYQIFRALKVREDQGLILGFTKHRDKDGVLHDPVGIGWLFDDVALMVAQDNSMFGYRAKGVFDFKDPSTTYVSAGFRKKLAEKAILYTDLMYAFGRGRPGELTTLSHLHALGLETRLDIRANWRNRFQFRFDLPLRIEHGSSRFYVEQGGRVYPLVIDLVPAARQSSLSFNHRYRLSRKSQLISKLNYTHNPDHRRGRNNYRTRVFYRIEF